MFVNVIQSLEKIMLYSMLLGSVARTSEWSISVGLIMITCNLLAFAIGRFAIKQAGESKMALPTDMPAVMQNFGIPELLAVASFGHILGAGMILGLSNAGLL
jgi:photosystem I subunit 10